MIARDEDSGTQRAVNTNAADEAAVDLPSGGSWTSFVAPLAVSQAAGAVLGSTPSGSPATCARGSRSRRSRSRCASATATSPTAAGQADDGSITNAVLSGAVQRPRRRARVDRRLHGQAADA